MNRRNLLGSLASLGLGRRARAAPAQRRDPFLDALIDKHHLGRHRAGLVKAAEPAIALTLLHNLPGAAGSRFGGGPHVPATFVWPTRRTGRRLDFLLQLDLAEVRDEAGRLPRRGRLAFFYDCADQPWGFDPAKLDGFRVVHFDEGTPLVSRPAPDQAVALPSRGIRFSRTVTLPSLSSRAGELLARTLGLTRAEEDRFADLADAAGTLGRPKGNPARHQLFGHSSNIQGDMQLEAQLVSNGLYCGDERGYRDPRRPQLERDADQWVLLLQLDSDDQASMMWGDAGMLYFWIRKDDLRACRFEKVWMTLQCG